MKKKIVKPNVHEYNRLVEYNYIGKDPIKETDDDDENLLFSNKITEEEDEFEEIDDINLDDFSDDVDGEESMDEPMVGPTDEPMVDQPNEPEEEVEVTDGEVELDVTDIVTKSEEAASSSQEALGILGQVMAKFEELEDRMSSMDAISDKIDSLEQEVEKRNPTPIEKMELRSLDSFPYQVKLDDFWAEKEGYEVNGEEPKEDENGEKVYKIDKEQIDATYDEGEARDSFGSE